MPDLLFEIGTEELPPGLISNLSSQIKDFIINKLNENNLSFRDCREFNTPRRIAIYISEVPNKQEIKTQEVKGPPKEQAFDQSGNPTQVALGFANKHNINPKYLTTKKINNSEYIFASVQTGGKDTISILACILADSIKHTTGEKFMYWGNYNERFARPIRWLLAILDNKVIDFTYSGITTSTYSFGHRILSNKKILIPSPKEYENILEENYVIASQEKRCSKIKQLLQSEAKKVNGLPLIDDQLLNEVANITEYPTSILGHFDESFLQLPKCITQTVLNSHQKYFAITKDNREKTLLPYFIIISNVKEEFKEQIKKGNEKVTKARLKDAQFFLNEDLKVPFNYETRRHLLAKTTFQKGLGSMEDKVTRISKLSDYIYETLNSPIKQTISKEDIITTAKLAKIDLTTHLVFEFTELQGEIGTEYAKLSNYKEQISQGIKEHYYPRYSGDSYPETLSGFIVGIADKLDNIICLFAAGKLPSSSTDPFALRRQAQGTIENIFYKRINLNLTDLINFSIKEIISKDLQKKLDQKKEKQIREFLTQRLTASLEERGFEYDLISAVISIGDPLQDILFLKERVETIQDYFVSNLKDKSKLFLIAAKRLVRIVENSINGDLKIECLKSDHEKALFNKFQEIYNKPYVTTKDYLNDLCTLTDSINIFFDKVLVNDPDPKIRQTRQALLKKGKELFERVCDFNKIQERN